MSSYQSPLPADVQCGDFTSTGIPQYSQPRRRHPFQMARSGKPGQGVGARLAPDGSRWCAFCNTTTDPHRRQHYCANCRKELDRRRHRVSADRYVRVPGKALSGLLDAADELRGLLSEAHESGVTYEDLTTPRVEELFAAAWRVTAYARRIQHRTD